MLKSLFASFFLVLLTSFTLSAQAPDTGLRKISSGTDTYQSAVPNQVNLRIENGKVWVNGNLMAEKSLPPGLRKLDPNIHYKSAAFGVGEISFSLFGTDYLVKDDRIVEMPSRATSMPAGPEEDLNTDAMEEYYSNMKRDSPNLFYSLRQQASLSEKAKKLVYDYQFAKGKEKSKIRDQLEVILSQLFEITEHNREEEIQELQDMIDAAQKEVNYRRANKDLIIDSTIRELIGE